MEPTVKCPFSIWVDYQTRGINLYSSDLFEPYQFGEYSDCAAAQAACRQMIDEDIAGRAQPGVPAERIMAAYEDQGVNPRIIHRDGSQAECSFNSAEYAWQRARELAGDLWNEADVKVDRACSNAVETILTSSEIVNRIRAIGEPRTFGGLTTAGGLDGIVRLADGESIRFSRKTSQGPVELSVVLPSGSKYRSEERRWERAAAILEPQSPQERAMQTLLAATDGTIDLSYHSLTSLPGELWALSGTTSLALEGNWLRSLPSEIGGLSKLKTLDLADNLLTALPREIGRLVSLESLQASGNLLSTVPDEVCQLTNLAGLSLSYNRLTGIPEAIWKLSRLRVLRLDHNLLSRIPVQVCQLMRLERLKLSHNRLGALPLEIGRLKGLKDADEIFAETKKFHPPSPDELSALDATANPIAGNSPSLSGRLLRNYLEEQLNLRLAAVPWQDFCPDQALFAIRMPAPPVASVFERPPKTLQWRVQFSGCLFSVAARELPQGLDQASLMDSLERLEAEYAGQQAAPAIRSKRSLGHLAGIEHILETPAGVLRLHTYLSTFELFQVQVEGPPACAFAAESSYFLDSFRQVNWKDHKFDWRICLGIAEDESLILQRLIQAFPMWKWSEGDSAWDKIRVSGNGLNGSIRVYRREAPGPFDLTIGIRAREGFDEPESIALELRGTVLDILRATLYKAFEPQPVMLVKLADGQFPEAYRFECDHSIGQIKVKLDNAEFWYWESRSDHLVGRIPFRVNGELTWTGTERVRIYGEGSNYRIEVGRWQDQPSRTPTCDGLHEIVQNTLLPAIDARNVTSASP